MTENSSQRKFSPLDFQLHEKLFRAFRKSDLNDGIDTIEANAISFPDFSCNWNRFSQSADIRNREKGKMTDGCFSFTVETAQFNKMATPCHDPLPQNYSHTEIRQLTQDEPIFFEPPKGRKLDSHNWSKTKRQQYRQNIINNLIIEIEASA
jgi:hypothetical protein